MSVVERENGSRRGWGRKRFVCIFSSTPTGSVEDETKPQEIETSAFQFGARKGPEEGRGHILWAKHAAIRAQ
jgi:hypothetical protein